MSTYGIKMSKPGYDVKTTADKNLIFISTENTKKDYISGYASYTESSQVTRTIYNHGLGYVPSIKIYYDNDDGVWHDALNATGGIFVGPSYEIAVAYADADNLYVEFGPLSSTTYNVRYFIFKNEAV